MEHVFPSVLACLAIMHFLFLSAENICADEVEEESHVPWLEVLQNSVQAFGLKPKPNVKER